MSNHPPGHPDHSPHHHTFGQDSIKPGEQRTVWVTIITAAMMVIEIVAGIAFGSMAVLADGLHMASHTAALGIAVLAYVLARRHAHDPRFSFGTGKVNALGGFASAVLLAGFATYMAVESLQRFLNPVVIIFDQALIVAVLGLIVNAISAVILGAHGHDHGDDHSPQRGQHVHHAHHDHNLRAAYIHVMADALTSLLAIMALLAGKYLGANWLDPMMGLVGAILVGRWSIGLLRGTAAVLLDRQAPEPVRRAVRERIDNETGVRLTDLHIWSIGPEIYAAEIALVAAEPRSPEHFKRLLLDDPRLVHVTVEIHHGCAPDGEGPHA